MCKWCSMYGLKHGKWYLNPDNHSRRLQEDPERKARYAKFASKAEGLDGDDRFTDNELYVDIARREELSEQRGKAHFAQIVPLEDANAILELADPIGVHACICRRMNQGTNTMVCLKFGLPAMKAYDDQPFDERKVHQITKKEAKALVAECDRKAYVHMVFTYLTPYVGSLCNCGFPACNELRERILRGITEECLKSHYVGVVDLDMCDGCGRCFGRCLSGALKPNRVTGKVLIIPTMCWGCGLCRAVCRPGAISLVDRESIPGLKDEW